MLYEQHLQITTVVLLHMMSVGVVSRRPGQGAIVLWHTLVAWLCSEKQIEVPC
jgi:hypothetical protein